ncbi:hypothetical protein N7447_008664 [Penicillium robsamsonii]|uniref:uncharacterized protein n=1 Tax=Penicillium robsamsonii TaxID=1792511 RepID=UPI0025485542|nr:uncharacterized protein N7447_008664 [Penicillium robsamsonii]KAJ5816431.1 hypothetical protein N7447_008664 [Penicillium robsamsonii]
MTNTGSSFSDMSRWQSMRNVTQFMVAGLPVDTADGAGAAEGLLGEPYWDPIVGDITVKQKWSKTLDGATLIAKREMENAMREQAYVGGSQVVLERSWRER